ncbi:MAG: 3'-5' exonuclease domain-containing protein 2 [Mediterranea massiliensis]|nr:3'-5' exonuclease domain-containing protein 2 [Mediterranea massiliensis]
MLIHRTVSKEEIQEMPKASFPGEIHVISTIEEAEKAIQYLEQYTLLGIDSETRPAFNKGQIHKVALLQISSQTHCFLFRLNLIGLPQPLIALLENPRITKVGLSLKDDFMMLHKRASFQPQSVVELQEFVRPFGINEMSLQKIFAILFGEKISKSQQLSNWESPILSSAQQNYAATDAWACLHIYQLLQELKENGNFEIEQP